MAKEKRRPAHLTPSGRLKASEVNPLPAAFEQFAPPAVRKASEQLAAADARLFEAKQACRDAEQAVRATRHADRAASEAAMARGKPLPAPALPDAERELDEAKRRRAAAGDARAALALDFAAALRECADGIEGKAADRIAEISSEAGEHIDRLEALLTERVAIQLGRRALQPDARGEFPPPPRPGRRRRDPISGPLRKLVESLRGTFGAGGDE